MKRKGFTLIEVLVVSALIGMVILGVAKMSESFLSGFNYSYEETQAISEAQQAITIMEREIREMRDGVDGSYPLVVANDSELVIYSDVDDDTSAERVRYYLLNGELIRQVFEYIPGTGNYACVNGCDICHDPGGNENTITIPESAWPAHSAHGDYLGSCVPGGGGDDFGSSSATERIFASYVQEDSGSVFTYYNGDWPTDQLNNPLIETNRLLNTRLIEINMSVNINPNSSPEDFNVSTSVNLRNLKDNL